LRHGGIIEHKFLNIKYIITTEKDFLNTHADAFVMPSLAAFLYDTLDSLARAYIQSFAQTLFIEEQHPGVVAFLLSVAKASGYSLRPVRCSHI